MESVRPLALRRNAGRCSCAVCSVPRSARRRLAGDDLRLHMPRGPHTGLQRGALTVTVISLGGTNVPEQRFFTSCFLNTWTGLVSKGDKLSLLQCSHLRPRAAYKPSDLLWQVLLGSWAEILDHTGLHHVVGRRKKCVRDGKGGVDPFGGWGPAQVLGSSAVGWSTRPKAWAMQVCPRGRGTAQK